MPFMIKCILEIQAAAVFNASRLCEYISEHHAPGKFDFIERNVFVNVWSLKTIIIIIKRVVPT